tara:strand:+ start:309 stop:428 length:120 start_codon:yes stop_codon:yes gene_type:complete
MFTNLKSLWKKFLYEQYHKLINAIRTIALGHETCADIKG